MPASFSYSCKPIPWWWQGVHTNLLRILALARRSQLFSTGWIKSSSTSSWPVSSIADYNHPSCCWCCRWWLFTCVFCSTSNHLSFTKTFGSYFWCGVWLTGHEHEITITRLNHGVLLISCRCHHGVCGPGFQVTHWGVDPCLRKMEGKTQHVQISEVGWIHVSFIFT